MNDQNSSRLHNEYDALKHNFDCLVSEITTNPHNLPHRALMLQQLSAMASYASILLIRINDANNQT